MRVFVAGATGAIGKQLVPRLVAAGHEVVGMTRSESKRALLRELGAEPVVADALDPDQVAEAVARARPEVIVHQLTAIGSLDPRHFDRDFALSATAEPVPVPGLLRVAAPRVTVSGTGLEPSLALRCRPARAPSHHRWCRST